MGMNVNTAETVQAPTRRAIGRDKREQKQLDALAIELRASLAREKSLKNANSELLRRQDTLAQEFEHRLSNSLQLIVGSLSLQSWAASTAEVADQLAIAARRIMALGRVHNRLRLLDQKDKVEFKPFLEQLCLDLADLLFEVQTGDAIVVEGPELQIPVALAAPLGFILNELITNSVKYSKSRITVRTETMSPASHSLSVSDNGPGLGVGFDPTNTGRGIKIIQSLADQIGATFKILPSGHGTRFIVSFRSDASCCATKL